MTEQEGRRDRADAAGNGRERRRDAGHRGVDVTREAAAGVAFVPTSMTVVPGET